MISHRIGYIESLQSEGIKASLFRKCSSTCSSKGEHDNILGFSSFLSWFDGKVSYGRWELLQNYWVLISVKYFSLILRRISTSSLSHRRMSRACCSGDELVPSPFSSKHESGGTVFITPWKRILVKEAAVFRKHPAYTLGHHWEAHPHQSESASKSSGFALDQLHRVVNNVLNW